MHRSRLFCLPIVLLVAPVLLVGCDENAPAVTIDEVDYDCGRPTVTATVDRDDETITNVVVNWGRNPLATGPPDLYAGDDLGPAFGASDDWRIQNTNGADVSLPASEDLDLFLRFDFAEPLAPEEKLVMNLQVQYERPGEAVQSVFSERITVPYDSTGTGCSTGEDIGVGDPTPVTCPDTTVADGGLAVPVVDPSYVDGPQDGAEDVGILSGNRASVPFQWREVDGHAETVKAYQVETRRVGQPSCLSAWSAEGSAHWSGSEETCIIHDANTNGTALSLLQGEAYEWRVRASCTQPDDALASGPFTPFMRFTTVAPPE